MSTINRRAFVKNAAIGSAALLAPRALRAADSRIEILLGEPIAPVSADLFGHFVEHLGGVVYDGVWVGENSKIPNYDGIRKELVDALRRLRPGVIRWPGGCFADSYNWHDGVGPRNQRPRRTNFWIDDPNLPKDISGPQRYDPNGFGTNEFIRFCRQVGAQPYLAANVRSLTPRDFYEWVEYCNSPAGSTTLAELRAREGAPHPLGVHYWGIGNEPWGCGGNFTPEEYATEFRRFTAWIPRYGVDLSIIGAGPNGGDTEWTRRFFLKLTEKGKDQVNTLYGWALHHYSWNVGKGQNTDWVASKGEAIKFSVEDWYELLREADQMETLIMKHWSVMGEIDHQHRVKLVVDEWGAWHKSGSEADPTHLYGQTSTLRDALLAALTLDTFIRHADKVAVANVAQLINCLHSLFTAHEERFLVTPNYHVFDMYAAHQGNQSVRTLFSVPQVSCSRLGKPASFWGLAGSASIQQKRLVLTVVNPDTNQEREAEIAVRSSSVLSGRATTLTASDIHAYNSFDNLRAVEPKESVIQSTGKTLVYRFPAASVTRLTLELG